MNNRTKADSIRPTQTARKYSSRQRPVSVDSSADLWTWQQSKTRFYVFQGSELFNCTLLTFLLKYSYINHRILCKWFSVNIHIMATFEIRNVSVQLVTLMFGIYDVAG